MPPTMRTITPDGEIIVSDPGKRIHELEEKLAQALKDLTHYKEAVRLLSQKMANQ